MAELMLVTSRPPAEGGGRDLLSRVHRKCLESLLGDRLIVEELDSTSDEGRSSLPGMLSGRIDGLSSRAERRIIERARAEEVSAVFLNGSNLGHLAPAVKKRLPGVEVLTFFHNVEARFFLGSLRQRRSLRALGVLIANYAAERKAVRHSDRLIALSRRDGGLLARLYGRSATDILPMAMEDRRRRHSDRLAERPDFALFVGGAFYANQSGIRWFAEKISPRIGLDTVVVGHGLEEIRGALERNPKVAVIGGVDSLEAWYSAAKVSIAPIFDGSGMKTKVAEALMFGKRIAGTSEAFSGYEEVAERAGWVCDTEEEFISALAEAEEMELPAFDPALRALYERHYSYDAALVGFARILGRPAEPQSESDRAA